MTVDRIEADGLVIDARVPMGLSGDDPVSLARSSALALTGVVALIMVGQARAETDPLEN